MNANKEGKKQLHAEGIIWILPREYKTQWLFVRHPYADVYFLFIRESFEQAPV